MRKLGIAAIALSIIGLILAVVAGMQDQWDAVLIIRAAFIVPFGLWWGIKQVKRKKVDGGTV